MNELTGKIDPSLMVRMPRPPRVQYEGAFYHVYTRGNRRERTYHDADDYREFEETMLDLYGRMDVNVYAWSLMPNHFHLLIETPRANLAAFMQRLLTSYARYFNRRNQFVGHVFQGRYQSKICDREAYLRELVRYIHLNPYWVKNRRWTVPAEGWPWSSQRYYVGGDEPAAAKPQIHAVLRRFGDDIETARQRYAVFVADGLADGTWEDFYPQQGAAKAKERFVEDPPPEGPSGLSSGDELPHVTLSEVVDAACARFGVDHAAFRGPSKEKRISEARKAIIAVAHRRSLRARSALAREPGRSPSAIAPLWRRIEEQKHSSAVSEFIENYCGNQGAARRG